MKPVRIQRSRQHKQVSPNGLPVVYVGRPSRFGNPFWWFENEKAVDWFKAWLKRRYFLDDVSAPTDEEIIKKLRGKNLSCWCKIGEPCHADILLEIANS